MSDSEKSRILSRATVREVLIVVAGILIAFSLDAWWDRVSTTASLREHADLVLDELLTTENALESAIDTHNRLLETTRSLVVKLEAVSPGNKLGVPDTTVAALMLQSTVDVGASYLESFLESGGSLLIDDPQARRLARSWPTRIEDTIDDQVYLRENYTVPLAVYLRSTFPLRRSETTTIDYLSGSILGMSEMMAGLKFEDIQITPEMELLNLLNARISMEKFMTLSLGEVLEANRELIAIFEKI